MEMYITLHEIERFRDHEEEPEPTLDQMIQLFINRIKEMPVKYIDGQLVVDRAAVIRLLEESIEIPF